MTPDQLKNLAHHSWDSKGIAVGATGPANGVLGNGHINLSKDECAILLKLLTKEVIPGVTPIHDGNPGLERLHAFITSLYNYHKRTEG